LYVELDIILHNENGYNVLIILNAKPGAGFLTSYVVVCVLCSP